MKYAITGATGFIGSALAHRLAGDGHDVVATVRNPAKAQALTAAGIEVQEADLGDVAGMAKAFEGCAGVFHVAGWYKVGSSKPEEGWLVNVEGTKNVVAATVAAQVPRLVYTSTCAVNSDTESLTVDESYHFTGRHLTTYDETKARAHDYVVQFAKGHDQPEVVIVMPGGVYGPGDTSQVGQILADVADGKRVIVSSSLRMMQAHVDDIADGHVRAMELGRPGESYMLVGERTDLRTMATEMADLTGGKKPIDMPRAALPVAEKFLSAVGRMVSLPPEFSAEAMRSSRASYLATSAKANRELGWTYRPLFVGLRETAEAEGWI